MHACYDPSISVSLSLSLSISLSLYIYVYIYMCVYVRMLRHDAHTLMQGSDCIPSHDNCRASNIEPDTGLARRMIMQVVAITLRR